MDERIMVIIRLKNKNKKRPNYKKWVISNYATRHMYVQKIIYITLN